MGNRDDSEARRSLTVAVAQPLVRPGDVRENLQRMRPLVTEAATRGAALVAFSECGITGYDLDERAFAARFGCDAPALDEVAAMAAEDDITIVTGFYEQADDGVYNTAVAVAPDGGRVYQRKHKAGKTPGVSAEMEANANPRDLLCAGPRDRTALECGGLRLAMVICADNGIPGLYDELAAKGFDGAVLMTAGCGRLAAGYRRDAVRSPEQQHAYLARAETVCFPQGLVERAMSLDLALISVNQVGYEPEMDFFHPGHSAIVDRGGRLEALIPGQFIFEHLKPELALGTITGR